MILSKPTSATGTHREMDIVVNYIFPSLFLHFGLKKVDQISGNKGGRTASPNVNKFFAGIQVWPGHVGEGFSLIIQVMKDPLNQPFMLPGKATIEQRNSFALFSQKWPGLIGCIVGD
jgi:hypothetical protein